MHSWAAGPAPVRRAGSGAGLGGTITLGAPLPWGQAVALGCFGVCFGVTPQHPDKAWTSTLCAGAQDTPDLCPLLLLWLHGWKQVSSILGHLPSTGNIKMHSAMCRIHMCNPTQVQGESSPSRLVGAQALPVWSLIPHDIKLVGPVKGREQRDGQRDMSCHTGARHQQRAAHRASCSCVWWGLISSGLAVPTLFSGSFCSFTEM